MMVMLERRTTWTTTVIHKCQSFREGQNSSPAQKVSITDGPERVDYFPLNRQNEIMLSFNCIAWPTWMIAAYWLILRSWSEWKHWSIAHEHLLQRMLTHWFCTKVSRIIEMELIFSSWHFRLFRCYRKPYHHTITKKKKTAKHALVDVYRYFCLAQIFFLLVCAKKHTTISLPCIKRHRKFFYVIQPAKAPWDMHGLAAKHHNRAITAVRRFNI